MVTQALSLRLKWALIALAISMGGCAFGPPSNPDNICEIFSQKWWWHSDAKRSAERWDASIPIMMAIMYQESAFVADAKPPRVRVFGIPMWWRESNASGYAQALTPTWRWYEQSTGRKGRRDSYKDAIDFIGWYNNMSGRLSGIRSNDAYSLYLAYHEGHGGFNDGSYRNKQWLITVAQRVKERADRYDAQYQRCR